MIRALLIIGAATAAGAYLYRSRRAPQRLARTPELEGAGVPNDVLVEPVRAQLRALVPDPNAIELRASAGMVTVGGTLAQQDRDRVLRAVLAVPGVTRVLNQSEIRDEPLPSPGSRAGA